MTTALRGRRNADRLRAKRDLLLAYHSGAFAGIAAAGKLEPFEHYAKEGESGEDQRLENARAIHFFHTLKAKGFPVKISRTVN